MKNKIIKLGVDARKELMKGADFLADAVQSTLGPNGVNFYLEKGDKFTSDGRNIAAEISHSEEIPNRAVKALRNASIDTEKEVGNASTTAVVLGRAILREAAKQLPSETIRIGKMTPGQLIKKIGEEVEEVVEKLKGMSDEITTEQQLIDACVVAAKDKELGELIGKAQWQLGPEGILIAEETIAPEHSVEFVEGVLIDNGTAAPLLFTNLEKQSLEITKAKTLLTDYVINELDKQLGDILEQLAKLGCKRLILVARAFSDTAINECMEYTKRGMGIFPINAPYTDMKEVFKDLAATLGGTYISTETKSLSDILLTDIGYAEYLSAERWRTIFAGSKDERSKERVNTRIAELKEFLKGNMSAFERKTAEARIAQLSSGFGIVKVGSPEAHRKRLKDAADDTVVTARVVFKAGVVPGGGLAFKTISESLPNSYLLKRPLMTIHDQIISTSPEGFVVEDWVKDGTLTLITALRHASVAASNLATAGGVDATEKDRPMWVQQSDKKE